MSRFRSYPASLLALCLSGCGSGVLDPRGPIGSAERVILLNSLAIMLAVVVPTILATLVFAWWFRSSNSRAKYLPDWAYSGRLEFVVWAIPALIVIFLAGIAWIGSHSLDPYRTIASKSEPLEVEVVSLDWKWLFIYPSEGVASVNELVVPVETPVHFRLTSASVMNSFFVPQLGSQIYTMARMTTHLTLRADHPGSFRGLSAQFSGDGFSDMHFAVRSVERADFRAWIETARSRGGRLDYASYAALALPSKADPIATFGVVSDGLFEAIVSSGGGRLAAPKSPPAARNIQ